MEIIILGTGCAKCQELEKTVEKAVKELDLDAETRHVTDLSEIMSYGVMSMPALVVDGEIRIKGRVPDKKEIKQQLQ